MTTLREAAHQWISAGFSVIPIQANGTKRPLFEWKRFMSQRATPDMIDFWLDRNPGAGIGLVCGAISGNLEMLELEGRATDDESLAKILAETKTRDVDSTWSLLNLGLIVESPSGGVHFFYRIEDHKVPGNTKVARRPPTEEELAENPKDKIKVLAETRGEGGYCVAAPSGGTVHPTGLDWHIISGHPSKIPTINWAERNALHEAIHAALDQMPEPEPRAQNAPPRPASTQTDGLRPGDDFNERAEWHWPELLGGAGWTESHRQGQVTYWVKPGSNPRDGHHATTGRDGTGATDRLYVFSTATEFDTETPLSKFHVYATLHHGGDYGAATKALAAMGFGEPLKPKIKTEPLTDFWDTASDFEVLTRLPQAAVVASSPAAAVDRARGREDWTLTGAVNRLVRTYGQHLRYVREEGTWRVWDGTRWARDDQGYRVMELFEIITDELDAEADKLLVEQDPRAKALRRHVDRLRDSGRQTARTLAASKLAVSVRDFDADPRYLNLLNGVYDLVADKFTPHDPKLLLSVRANITYDPDAVTDKAEAFFKSLLPDDAVCDYFLRSLAYGLTGENDRKSFFVAQGPSNCGKTQVGELMYDLLGADEGYAIMISPYAFMHRREATSLNTEIHSIRGKRMVFTSETPRDMILDEQLVKRLTGKDTMSTRTLHEKDLKWRCQAAIFIATNNLPRLSGDDEAMWKRVKTIPFRQIFTDDGTSGNVAVMNIGQTLAAEDSSGIFNLLLAALRRYRADGRLAVPEQVAKATEEHRLETDPAAQLAAEAQEIGLLTPEPEAKASIRDIYAWYAQRCRDNGATPLGPQRFGVALRGRLKYETVRSNGLSYCLGWKWSGPTAVNWMIGGFGGPQGRE